LDKLRAFRQLSTFFGRPIHMISIHSLHAGTVHFVDLITFV